VPTVLEAHDQVKAAAHTGRRIVALDGLRGVAAIMVLLHHALLMLPQFADYEWYSRLSARLSLGEFLLLRTPLRLVWAGQERAIMFFVLSGFVLSLPWLNGKPQSYGRFLLGRFCRIYPPYLAAMTLAALGSILMGGHVLPKASVYFNELGWAVWRQANVTSGRFDCRPSLGAQSGCRHLTEYLAGPYQSPRRLHQRGSLVADPGGQGRYPISAAHVANLALAQSRCNTGLRGPSVARTCGQISADGKPGSG
jgi:Acyltransferase family